MTTQVEAAGFDNFDKSFQRLWDQLTDDGADFIFQIQTIDLK